MFTIYELPIGDGSSKLYTKFYTPFHNFEFGVAVPEATHEHKVRINVQTYRSPVDTNRIIGHLTNDLESEIKSAPRYSKWIGRAGCVGLSASGITLGNPFLAGGGVLLFILGEVHRYFFNNPKGFGECIRMLKDGNYEFVPTINEELKDIDEVISGGKKELGIRELMDKRMKGPVNRLLGDPTDPTIPENVKELYATKLG